MIVGRLSAVVRVVLATLLGIAASALLARASDALWWQVLPWVLLAAFWAYLLQSLRRSLKRSFLSGPPTRAP